MQDQRRITIPKPELKAIQLDIKDVDGFSKKGIQANRVENN